MKTVADVLLVEGKRPGSYDFASILEKAGYRTQVCYTGAEAVQIVQTAVPKLLIFDASTMRTNGARICQRLRREAETLPIIHIRAAHQELDAELEVDALLELPFTPRKLLNRVRSLYPVDESKEEIVRYGYITLYLTKRSVEVNGRGESQLTPKLAQLLEAFLRHPNEVVTRRLLMQQVWNTDYVGDTRTLDVHIRWMRELIEEDPAHPQRLVTVRGQGYILQIQPPEE